MSKSGDLDWPPRSPDLTPPDFFLWGYLKLEVYVNKPRTVEELKDNTREEIAAIPAEMLTKTIFAFLCNSKAGADLLLYTY